MEVSSWEKSSISMGHLFGNPQTHPISGSFYPEFQQSSGSNHLFMVISQFFSRFFRCSNPQRLTESWSFAAGSLGFSPSPWRGAVAAGGSKGLEEKRGAMGNGGKIHGKYMGNIWETYENYIGLYGEYLNN